MNRKIIVLLFMAAFYLCGCGSVQREISINTEPAGATVILNDEEIGESPVTVPFNWYGDYNIRITKEGYQSLVTHGNLKAPWYDYFPFDLVRAVMPGRKVDRYEWAFQLTEASPPSRQELIESADKLMQEHKSGLSR